jgi:hypothetical protein
MNALKLADDEKQRLADVAEQLRNDLLKAQVFLTKHHELKVLHFHFQSQAELYTKEKSARESLELELDALRSQHELTANQLDEVWL